MDSVGHLYVAGSTATNDLVATTNTYQAANAGLTDIFVAVIDTTPGKGFPILYFSYAGGTGTDIPLAMALDSSGNIYLTGTTNSTDFPTAGSAIANRGGGIQYRLGLRIGAESRAFLRHQQSGVLHLPGRHHRKSKCKWHCPGSEREYLRHRHHQLHRLPGDVDRLSVDTERTAGRLSVQDQLRPRARWPIPRIWAANWKTMAGALP